MYENRKERLMSYEIKDFQLVLAKEGQAITTSVIVAKGFDREHKNVMQSVQKLIEMDKDDRLKFKLTSYIDVCNRAQPMYEMNWKSFSILAMGFDGERAFQWKLKFADAFEEMAIRLHAESDLSSQNPLNIQAYLRTGSMIKNEIPVVSSNFIL